MRTTKFLLSTLKEIPNQSQISSHQLMLRAGIIRKLSSGLYSWLPSGIKILQKIKKIIRKEMNENNMLEIMMPTMQPINLWKKSNRINLYGNELFKVIDRRNKTFILSPTHEEVITKLIGKEIYSYKQLPMTLYQIQNKFRDEIRPQFGVIRSREFIMKDAYSFHLNNDSLTQSYNLMKKKYSRIFNKINLNFCIIKADSSVMGGNISHEFQALSKKKTQNAEFFKKNSNISTIIKHKDKLINNIEIAHIFQIGNQYSKQMNVSIKNKNGSPQFLYMGCYGIGITRTIAAVIEQHYDKKGIIWPDSISPFLIAILPINMHKSHKVRHISEHIYNILKKNKIDVIIDDRNAIQPGFMFSEIELIGIPHNIIVSDRHIINNNIEYFHRKSDKKTIIEISKINLLIKNITKKFF